MPGVNAFISHRHADKQIAGVINAHLQKWGVKQSEIFQSSRPRQGLAPGDPLHAKLKERLREVNLFILIYTFADEDWAYCTLEYGIATGSETADTRTVILQCGSDNPKWFDELVRITITKSSVKSFVSKFHTEVGFIPGLLDEDDNPTAFFPEITDALLETRTDELYEDMVDALPEGTYTSAHIWDFLRLRLAAEHVKALKTAKAEEASDIIRENAEVLEPVHEGLDQRTDAALRQFGYHTYESGLKLIDVENRWRDNSDSDSSDWITSLHDAILKAAHNDHPTPVAHSLKSVRKDTNWHFIPAVTRIRGFPDASKEFDVYLIRVDPSIEVPGKAPAQKKRSTTRSSSKKKPARN